MGIAKFSQCFDAKIFKPYLLHLDFCDFCGICDFCGNKNEILIASPVSSVTSQHWATMFNANMSVHHWNYPQGYMIIRAISGFEFRILAAYEAVFRLIHIYTSICI